MSICFRGIFTDVGRQHIPHLFPYTRVANLKTLTSSGFCDTVDGLAVYILSFYYI